MTLNGVIAM